MDLKLEYVITHLRNRNDHHTMSLLRNYSFFLLPPSINLKGHSLRRQHQRDRNGPGIQMLLTQSQTTVDTAWLPWRETCSGVEPITLTKNYYGPSMKITGKREEREPGKQSMWAQLYHFFQTGIPRGGVF